MTSSSKKRKVRVTPFGYLVLAFAVALFVGGIILVSRLIGRPSVAKDGELSGRGDPLGVSMDATTQTNALDQVIEGASADTEDLKAPKQEKNYTVMTTRAPTPTISMMTTPVPVAGQATPTPTPALYSRMPTTEEIQNAKDGKLNTGGVNLRAGHTKNDKILGTGFTKGTKVKVYAREGDYYFVQIVSKQLYGFVSCDFVNVDGVTPEPVSTSVPENAVGGSVIATKAMLRRGPSKDYSGIRECRKGALLYVYYLVDDWYYVEVATTGEEGYIRSDFIATEGLVPERDSLLG